MTLKLSRKRGCIMWYQYFKEQYEELIINAWVTKREDEFPDNYDLEDLYPNGKQYYKLLVDIHIPLKEHPEFQIIPIMCKYHAERETPVGHVLHSSHVWRETVLEEIWSYFIENDIHKNEFRKIIVNIHKRIDEIQRLIASYYLDYAQKIINQKQKIIEEHHIDRLSMLGIMASSMAHELRNPLFAIEGFLKLIKDDLNCLSCPSNLTISRYIDVIEKEFEGLYRQITSFLSFSKSDGSEEPYVECTVSQIIETVFTLVQPRTVDENVEFIKLIETDSELVVQKNAIQQVLSNLINNSLDALSVVNYRKKIVVRIWEDSENIYMRVSDNGLGITQELEESIFEPFVTSKKNGTGLGLAICKQIMKKNSGDIYFNSHEGETVFTLSLVKK